jgi:hypothetical protein
VGSVDLGLMEKKLGIVLILGFDFICFERFIVNVDKTDGYVFEI